MNSPRAHHRPASAPTRRLSTTGPASSVSRSTPPGVPCQAYTGTASRRRGPHRTPCIRTALRRFGASGTSVSVAFRTALLSSGSVYPSIAPPRHRRRKGRNTFRERPGSGSRPLLTPGVGFCPSGHLVPGRRPVPRYAQPGHDHGSSSAARGANPQDADRSRAHRGGGRRGVMAAVPDTRILTQAAIDDPETARSNYDHRIQSLREIAQTTAHS